MSFTTAPDVPVPHLAVNEDLGSFVYGVALMGPGKHYMAEGTTCSWTDFLATWSRVTGKKANYVHISSEEMAQNNPDKMFGEELADMFAYSSEPGYDGGDKTLLKAWDIQKVFLGSSSRLSASFTNNWSGWIRLPNDKLGGFYESRRLDDCFEPIEVMLRIPDTTGMDFLWRSSRPSNTIDR